jgi:hypothetical protein
MLMHTVINTENSGFNIVLSGVTDAEFSRWYDANPYMRETTSVTETLTDGSKIVTHYMHEIG